MSMAGAFHPRPRGQIRAGRVDTAAPSRPPSLDTGGSHIKTGHAEAGPDALSWLGEADAARANDTNIRLSAHDPIHRITPP
jgi:hypothetical protein